MIAKGQVIDSKTKEELPQATIIVTDGKGGLIEDGEKTKADKNGNFTIDVFPPDFVTVSYIGYKNKTISIKDFSSDINVINLEYNKKTEEVKDIFKGNRGEEVDNGIMENKPIQWYYWASFIFIGYYIYTKYRK